MSLVLDLLYMKNQIDPEDSDSVNILAGTFYYGSLPVEIVETFMFKYSPKNSYIIHYGFRR